MQAWGEGIILPAHRRIAVSPVGGKSNYSVVKVPSGLNRRIAYSASVSVVSLAASAHRTHEEILIFGAVKLRELPAIGGLDC